MSLGLPPNLNVNEWPELPDHWLVLRPGWSLHFSAELEMVGIWSAEAEKHITVRSSVCSPENLAVAAAVLERECSRAAIN